jgi:protocatechuate 3,4-dioxygenase beta subunit
VVDGEVAVVKGRVVDAQGKPVVNVGEFMIEPRQTFVQKRRGC